VWPAEPSAHEAYWDKPETGLAGRAFKGVLSRPVRLALRSEWRPYRLRFEHAVASCRFTRDELLQAGLPMEQCRVIYEGIDPAPYEKAAEVRERAPDNGFLRAVFVGSLTPHKGAHTAIEALAHLKEARADRPVHLTVLGAGHPQYEQHLHELVERGRLDGQVSFHQPIPRSQLPHFLARFDVLVMPSVYKEPLARISQEALAAGLVLVATLTGGTGELLADDSNGLAFEPGDAEGLARQLCRLRDEPGLRQRLLEAGRQTATQRFTISRMIDELEAYLGEVAG
jgi:glycogen(starch) synthase